MFYLVTADKVCKFKESRITLIIGVTQMILGGFKIRYFLIVLFSFMNSVSTQADTWRGLKIEREMRCSPYNRLKDYIYPQTVENKIVQSLGNKIYSPYTGKFFKSTEDTDIEHIVSLSEAHDSGLCAADMKTRNRFASDINNLTLASPNVNRNEKSGHDASGWLPGKNKCWFVNKVIEVKKNYNLTVDSEELIALEKVISQCLSFEMIFFGNSNKHLNLSQQNTNTYITDPIKEGPIVKKSRSNICHWKDSSPYYSMTKNYQPFDNIQSCLKSEGRCPKKDSKCQGISANSQETFHKEETAPYMQKFHIEQNTEQGHEPNVKKSKSGICHAKNSSSFYSRTKNFIAYQNLESCLNSGGRCPKRDLKCQQVSTDDRRSFYKDNKVSHMQQPPIKQNTVQENEPNVKKSRSGICHSKASSSSYSKTKNFTAYQDLKSCLKSGGQCPKKDTKCQGIDF